MNQQQKRSFKQELFEQFARIGKAISSGPRIQLLELLSQAERTVEQLADESGHSFANVSRHLQILRAAQLVDVRRDGLYAFYRLSSEDVLSTILAVRALAESRLSEIERLVRLYLSDRSEFEAITAGELEKRIQARDVCVIDVRPVEEYRAGHIPGSQSVPLDQLEKRFRSLPRNRAIVAYCRGPFCVLTDEALRVLKRHGRKAIRLDVGLPEWKAAGLPIEIGDAFPS